MSLACLKPSFRTRFKLRSNCATLVVVAGFGLLAGLAACSPSSFFAGSGSPDSDIANRPSYRPINPACTNLDLSGDRGGFTPRSFRGLVRCLNSFGALQEFDTLLSKLSDADVKLLIEPVNDQVFRQPRVLFDLEQSYRLLKTRPAADSEASDLPNLTQLFERLSKVTENETLASATLRLLADQYDAGPRADLLRAVERLGRKLTPDTLVQLLEFSINHLESKSLYSLQTRFRPRSSSGRTVPKLVTAALQYLRDDGDPKHVNAGRELIRFSISGDLYKALDAVTGQTPDELRARIARLSALPRAMFADQARVFDGLSSLMNYANGEVRCLVNSQRVDNMAFYIVNQLAKKSYAEASTFLARDNLLLLMVSNPICDIPPQFAQYFPVLADFAETSAQPPMLELLKSLYSAPDAQGNLTRSPLLDLFVGLLADTGSGLKSYPGSGPRDTTGVKRLLPMLSELGDRQVWDDLFLVLSLASLEDRQRLIDFLKFVVQPSPAISGRSIFDVVANAMPKTSVSALSDFVLSLKPMIDRDDAVVAPFLRGVRSGLLSNDVFPVVEIARGLLTHATEYRGSLELLFRLARDESLRGDLEGSVRLLSRLAGDGRLQEIVDTTFFLFTRVARNAAHPIQPQSVNQYRTQTRHNWSARDLALYPIVHLDSNATDGCHRLPASFRIDRPSDARYAENFGFYADCMGGRDGQFNDAKAALLFLDRARTESGQSGFQQLLELVKIPGLTTPEARILGGTFQQAYDDGRFVRLQRAVPLFTRRALDSRHGPGALSDPLVTLLGPVAQVLPPRTDLRSVFEFSARTLRRADVPELLTYIETLWSREPDPQARPVVQPIDSLRIKRWLLNKECQAFSKNPSEREKQLDTAVASVVSEYANNVSNWEYPNGEPKQRWSFEDFKTQLDPVLQKVGDPAQSAPGRRLSQGLLNILKYYTLKPGEAPSLGRHFERSALFRWLKDRSDDYRLITYYPRGAKTPRVRLVNSLDRLEIVLNESDYHAPFPIGKNMALDFIGLIGDSWGDEPPELWPVEIREKFKDRGRPPTLAQAVTQIERTLDFFTNFLGLPPKPKCDQIFNPHDPDSRDEDTYDPKTPIGIPDWVSFTKPSIADMKRGLFNTREAIGILRDNLPGAAGPYSGGMRTLRNIFYELTYSTPIQNRKTNDTQGLHNLAVANRLSRMGIFRMIGRALGPADVNDSVLEDLFGALISAAENPRTADILDRVAGQAPARSLIWSGVDRVFEILNAAEGVDLSDERKSELAGKTSEAAEQLQSDWVLNAARMRQLALYLLPTLYRLDLLDAGVSGVLPILDRHLEFIGRQKNAIQGVLESRLAAQLVRAVYEDNDSDSKIRLASVLKDAFAHPELGTSALAILERIDLDPSSNQAWDTLKDRWRHLDDLPEYRQLDLTSVMKDLLHFFQGVDASADSRAVSRRILDRAAGLTTSGDLEQVLVLLRDHPEDFAQALRAIGEHVDDGSIPKFFDLVRQGLSNVPR